MPNLDIPGILSTILVLTFSLSLHEFAHGRMAYALGDDTAALAGRLTLNPLAHLDPLGTLAFLIARIGWAKPVPVNYSKLTKAKTPKLGAMLVSLAGPVSNLLLALVSAFLLNFLRVLAALLIVQKPDISPSVLELFRFSYDLCLSFYFSNIGLAIFNLLPLPPLDGSKILASVLPDQAFRWLANYERYIGLGLLALFLFGRSYMGRVLAWLATPFNYLLMQPWTSLANWLIQIILP
ncbi:MAG: site-2 protease family protein [Eubacteriales bacterium]|nr:site-2 protease family protein [Eubacteriales bacterium]